MKKDYLFKDVFKNNFNSRRYLLQQRQLDLEEQQSLREQWLLR